MALKVQILAAGQGWKADDVVCDYGPHDHSFVEEHAETAISVVTRGTFQYRTQAGSATLVPGSLLLGNADSSFECGHEYAQGDRCLAFHFAPSFFDTIAAGVTGARTTQFPCAGIPPMNELIGILAQAEVACDERDPAALEEIAIRIAGAALTLTADRRPSARTPSALDERRITRAVRRINEESAGPLTLNALAHESAMSPYHFLRTFRQVTGTTPHQYLLLARLHRAATRLRLSADAISTIAYGAGFNDLATFNRRFRRLIGATPSAYRSMHVR
jgi:AraC family transcriptional regulator